MMRALKPCGTYAAYRRHLRAKETPCEPCKQASRDQKNQRKDAARKAAAEEAREAAPAVVEIDRREVLLEVLASLRGQLQVAPPQSAGSIAKQIRDTLDALNPEKPESEQVVNPLDEIARKREERRKQRLG